MIDAWVQIAVFSFVVVAGLMWGRRAWRRWSEYSFAEDFRATFLRVRWAYSGDLCDGGLRLIAPAMVVCAGLGGLVWVLVRRASLVSALVGMCTTGCGIADYEVESAKVFGAPTDVYDLAAGSYVSLRSREALSGLELEVSGDCGGGVSVDPDDPTRATIQASATFLDLNHVGKGWCELSSRAERLDGDARSLAVYEVQKVKVTAVSPPMVTTAAVFGGASIQVTALYGGDVDNNPERTYTLNGFGLETWTITGATTVRSDPRRRLQDLVVTDAATVTITASVPGALEEPLTLEVVPLGAIARLRWSSVDGAVSFFPRMTSIELLPVTDQNVLILGDVEYEIEDASSGALIASGTGRSFETAPIRAHFANQMTGELRVRVAGHVELLRIVLVD